MPDSRDIYRAWLREVREDASEFGAWRADDITNTGDLDYHYNQFLLDLAQQLEDNGSIKGYQWLDKGAQAINQIKEKLQSKFDIPTDEETRGEYSGGLGTFSVINDTSGLIKRKKVFLTLAEITDYIIDVPYPAGIEIVYNSDGSVKEYYLWVEK
jgi:hypothetical protein